MLPDVLRQLMMLKLLLRSYLITDVLRTRRVESISVLFCFSTQCCGLTRRLSSAPQYVARRVLLQTAAHSCTFQLNFGALYREGKQTCITTLNVASTFQHPVWVSYYDNHSSTHHAEEYSLGVHVLPADEGGNDTGPPDVFLNTHTLARQCMK